MTHDTHHYIIGDIHGCLAELLELEQLIHTHATKHGATPVVVSVGDLVDRGPDSAGVIEHFRQGVAQGSHAAVAGNHDGMFLRALDAYAPSGHKPTLPHWCISFDRDIQEGTTRPARTLAPHQYAELKRLSWMGYGGVATLESFGCDPHDVSTWKVEASALEFLCALPLIWQSDEAIVTHALATPEHLHTFRTAHHQTLEYSKAAQALIWNRVPPKLWSDSRVHVSGHTVVDRPKWRKKSQMLQVDTGCVFGQRLTAWCPQTKSYLSVPSQMPH